MYKFVYINMIVMKKGYLFLFVVLMTLSGVMEGKVRVPSIISDNMVLQQKSSVKLWGWTEAGEQVSISNSWSSKVVKTTADTQGNWSVYIKTPGCGKGHTIEISSGEGEDKIIVNNVLIGEVWMASGQSNMEFEMRPHPQDKWMTGMYDWEKESADADYPDIHLFKVEEGWNYDTPMEDCEGEWVVCSPEVAKSYSAIAFLFARELHQTLERPVGIILCAYGGTLAESWTRREVMEGDPVYDKTFETYTREKAAVKGYHHKVPATIWNAMVNPIVGYTIKGNIWYQAESNAWMSDDYPYVFVKMVNDWRGLWGQKRLPFYYIQVAPYGDLPGDIRLQQAKVWEEGLLDDIGMTTAIDVGDSLDIHPKDKVTPAHRFVLLALANEYGFDVECEGPLLKEVKVDGDKMILSFKNSKGLYIRDDSGKRLDTGVRYLMIAGEDGVYHPAHSKVEGGKLVAWSPAVPHPAHIKYCTEDYCRGTIYNGADLPAYPFEY